MRRIRIHRREVLALDPRDSDIVRAKTIGPSDQRSAR
jgi:hypothetical protein